MHSFLFGEPKKAIIHTKKGVRKGAAGGPTNSHKNPNPTGAEAAAEGRSKYLASEPRIESTGGIDADVTGVRVDSLEIQEEKERHGFMSANGSNMWTNMWGVHQSSISGLQMTTENCSCGKHHLVSGVSPQWSTIDILLNHKTRRRKAQVQAWSMHRESNQVGQ